MCTSYAAIILSSMCMDYFSLASLDSIPHVRALLQAIIARAVGRKIKPIQPKMKLLTHIALLAKELQLTMQDL